MRNSPFEEMVTATVWPPPRARLNTFCCLSFSLSWIKQRETLSEDMAQLPEQLWVHCLPIKSNSEQMEAGLSVGEEPAL